MYVNYPSGKNYLEVTINNENLKIRLANYADGSYSLVLDKKCIPQLIGVLTELNQEES